MVSAGQTVPSSWISSLSTKLFAMVFGNTPNVLRVGPRCTGYGYSFHWPCGQAPYLVTPDGFQVDYLVENNVPILPTSHEVPKQFAVPAPKTRLEVLSRPNDPPAGGCNALACGDESTGANPAGGCDAPASGSYEPDTVVANPGDEDEAGLALETSSSDDDGEPDPRHDLHRAEAISTRHLVPHQPNNRYCKACIRCKMQCAPCRRGASSSYGPKPDKFGDICTLAITSLPATSCQKA